MALRTSACGTVLAGVACLGMAAVAHAADDPLAAYRWTSRVLVVSAPRPDDRRVAAQREAFAAAEAGMTERDLVTVELLGRDEAATRLRARLGLPKDDFRVVLIGKDGGVKLTRDAPIPTQTLFSTIDAMPMRREERRR